MPAEIGPTQLRRLRGRKVLRERRRRHLAATRAASTSRSTRAGSGRSCTRYRQGCPRRSSSSATASLAAIIRCSIRRVGLRLLAAAHGGHVALLVKVEFRLGRVDDECAGVLARAHAAPPEAARASASGAPHGSLACSLPARIRSHPLVVEALVGADQRPIEACCHAAAVLDLELGGHRGALDAGAQAARVARERMRQHRLDGSRHVHASSRGVAPPSRARHPRGRRHSRRRCGHRSGCAHRRDPRRRSRRRSRSRPSDRS